MDFETLLTCAGGAGAGGLSVGTLVILFIRHQLAADRAERASLREKVGVLENEKIVKLEQRLDKHIESCNPQAMTSLLQKSDALLMRVSDKVDLLSESVAALKSDVRANQKYTENIDKSLQRLQFGE